MEGLMERRLARLEAVGRGTADRALLLATVEEVAAERGLDPDELLREAEAILRQHAGKSIEEIAAILEWGAR
jgi:hypothetical protein